jgi:type II secretory pathway pseudopilin PulG
VTWPVVVLILGILAMAVARDVFLRVQRVKQNSDASDRIDALEGHLKKYDEDINRLDAIVRDQTNRLTLSRRRSG